MTTLEFITAIVNWELADPAHVGMTAAAICAMTPTPNPASPLGRAYKVLELVALNVAKAKDTGAPEVKNG